MKWKDKEIVQLTDEELVNASFELASILANYNSKKNDPKWEKKFKGQPEPTINLIFIQLQQEVTNEIEKRNLNHAS